DGMPDFIRDERHHGMQQPERSLEQRHQVLASDGSIFRTLWGKPWLDQLDIPIAEFTPEEIVDGIHCFVETISRQRFVHIFGNCVEAGKNPAVFESHWFESLYVRSMLQTWSDRNVRATRANPVHIHEHKPGRDSNLVGERPIAFGP